MILSVLTQALEELAPASLQEDYDNSGLIIGDAGREVGGCLITLDVTEAVLEEAVEKGTGLIISHHPLIFRGIRRLTGETAAERIIAGAIRRDIAIYAIHTNLDNISGGVSRALADKIGIVDPAVLKMQKGGLRKLVTFCPHSQAGQVREAIFAAGAGHIGQYDQCSFNAEGQGTFRAGEGANPFAGSVGTLHFEPEVRIETIFPSYLERKIIAALVSAHPYEEVAYDIYPLDNENPAAGSGLVGDLEPAMVETQFLQRVKSALGTPVLRHSPLSGRMIRKVAVCGGSGSFLISDAIRRGADAFVTADLKYHQFQEADGRILLIDAGHFETEQFTCGLLEDYLKKKFANFAVLISEVPVNPVNYF
jgi:dinuclear metal center YbgI/SA1388 family protein